MHCPASAALRLQDPRARTGHILGVRHPEERPMQAGTGTKLTPEEITTAGVRAAELAK